MAMTKEQQRALALARARHRKQQGNEVIASGGILPFSRQADGDVEFDSDAGLVGALKRAFMLPGEVAAGEVDPMSEEGLDRAAEMAAAVSPVNPAIRAGSRAVPGPRQALRRPKVKAPTTEELKAEAQAGYRGVRESGVDYTSQSIQDMARAARSNLEQDGLIAEVAPKTSRILRKLETPPENSVAPISSIASARKSFGHIKKTPEGGSDFAAAQRVRQRIADFIVEPPASGLVDRTPAGVEAARKAGRLQRNSDGNYAAAKRGETLAELRRTSEIRAGVSASGQNVDNATRQRLASLLLNDRRNAGFTDAEKAAVEKVALGSRSANTLRSAGNLLGGGGGLGAYVTGGLASMPGFAVGSPGMAMAGMALPVVGMATKRGGAALTQRGLRKIDEATRKRSPLYEERVRKMPMEAIAPDRRAALIRALILQAEQAQQAE